MPGGRCLGAGVGGEQTRGGNTGRPLLPLLRCSVTAPPWTEVHQAHLSMGFFRQEHWRGLPFPSPGDLPDPGIASASLAAPALQADSLLLSHWGRGDTQQMGSKAKEGPPRR